MKTVSISIPSLAIGALLTVGLFLVMGQAGPSTPPGSWGPPKKGVVNVFETQPVTVQPGAHHVVYQVPPDRWLTVTAVFVDALPTNGLRRWSEFFAGSYIDRGCADPQASLTGAVIPEPYSLLTSPGVCGGTTGWVFRPGSHVVIRNISQSPQSFSRLALVGYESRD